MSGRSLAGKTALVTGASRGLGRRAAERLAAEGAAVALVARGERDLKDAVRAIESRGGRAAHFTSSITTPESVDALRRDVESRLGPVDILVNAAGIFGPIQLIKDSDPQRWIETLQVNTIAPYLTCRAFVGGMIERGWGRIVNFTSAAALHPPGPLNSAYGTSKVALNQMTRHLAAELAGTGVTANVIHPGDVKTDMWASIRDEANTLGPEGAAYRQWVDWVTQTGGDDPEKAATLVLELVSEGASGVSGQFLWIKDPLQKPIASWGDEAGVQPWRK